MALLGWLITALAATLGAPFWFDVLNKVMVIRSTVKPREKSPDEGSEDRQLPHAALLQLGAVHFPAGPLSFPASATLSTPQDAENDVDATDIDLAAEEPASDEQLPR